MVVDPNTPTNPEDEETKIFKLGEPPEKADTPEFKAQLAAVRIRLPEIIRHREESIRTLKDLHDKLGNSSMFFITGNRLERAGEISALEKTMKNKEEWEKIALEQDLNFVPCQYTIDEIRSMIEENPRLFKKGFEVPNGIFITKDGYPVGCMITLKALGGDRVKIMKLLDFLGTLYPDQDLEF